MVAGTDVAPTRTIDALVAGLADLWTETLGDGRICIAVLDGPVDLHHPAFRDAKLDVLETLASNVSDNGLASRHGTHIASVLFGGHDGPVKGIAPHCRGLIIPVFKDMVDGSPVPCSQLDLARAINQAVVAGAHIINISGGEYSPTGQAHPILADAIRNCCQSGVLIVAAAGNQGCDCLHIPAALPAVIPVGAMDSSGHPLEFSNWGSSYRTRGVLAPGQEIPGAAPHSGVAVESGTSYATPILSGVVALLMSLYLVRNGTKLVSTGVRKAILETAIDCDQSPSADCLRLLAGRLNLAGARSLLFPGVQQMTEDLSGPGPTQAIAETLTRTDCASSIQGATPGLLPSGCGCGGNGNSNGNGGSGGNGTKGGNGGTGVKTTQFVYALGQLGIDFGTEARRDGIVQAMESPGDNAIANPLDIRQLLQHLEKNPWDAASLIWTLSIDATPVYAILAAGPYAVAVHEQLRTFLAEQTFGGVERVSIPGVIAGSIRLSTGQVVPAIVPEMRGMFSWSTRALVEGMAPSRPDSEASAEASATFAARMVAIQAGVNTFLERVYFELRNLGLTPQDRAINFAATNAFNIEAVVEKAVNEKLELDTIDVERSPVCRPESDCWDVKLTFFNPEREVQSPRRAYRFTVDVSDVVPVTVGGIRSWSVR